MTGQEQTMRKTNNIKAKIAKTQGNSKSRMGGKAVPIT